jgi:hypothetical protein
MTGFNCVRCGQFETSDPYPEDEEDMCYPCGICVYEGCEECGNEILGDLQNCNQCGANLCESCPCSCDILKSEELDDDEYWEPYLDVLETWYGLCASTVDEATDSWAGMVENIQIWQAVEDISSDSLSYILSKTWKYKYDAIRLLWNQEVDGYDELLFLSYLTTEEMSLLENFNPEGRDYEGKMVVNSWTGYPTLKEVKEEINPSWLPEDGSAPYAFDLYRAEEVSDSGCLVNNPNHSECDSCFEVCLDCHPNKIASGQGAFWDEVICKDCAARGMALKEPCNCGSDWRRCIECLQCLECQVKLYEGGDYGSVCKGCAPKVLNAESYKPPASAVTNAKRGLELRKEYGRGGLSPAEAKSQGIDSGVTRARKIASGKVSKHDVRRMSAFNRHRKNYRPEKKMPDGGPTAGTIAWLLWGGTSGVNWAKKKSAAMNAESISGDPWDEGSVADEVYKLFQKHGNINYWSYRQDDGNMVFKVILDPNQTESSDFAAEDYNSFTEEMESLIDKYGKLESYDTQFYDNLMDVSFSFRPHNSDFDDVDFDAEERYRQDYMVPADVHKIMEAAIHLQKLHEQHEGSYPEWWKSKLSVVASELDNLVDVLDYKVDHPEEFDAEELTGDGDIKVGDVVRSYDFCLGGKVTNDDCYVEGIVEKIEPVEWCGPNCDHYHIKTIRRIFNGKPTTYEDYYFPVADPQQSAVRRVARWSAEDWGGDPEGILAKALSRARMRSKEPRKPLKIEKLPHPDQKSLKDFEAVVIPETTGYAEQAAATRMAIEESEQQQKLLELQTLLKLKILSPEDVFARMLGE